MSTRERWKSRPQGEGIADREEESQPDLSRNAGTCSELCRSHDLREPQTEGTREKISRKKKSMAYTKAYKMLGIRELQKSHETFGKNMN